MFFYRSTEKNNFSADELVARLGEGSSKWAKAALQVLHRLWSDQGSLVNTHQESQAMLSIGQVGLHPATGAHQNKWILFLPNSRSIPCSFLAWSHIYLCCIAKSYGPPGLLLLHRYLCIFYMVLKL